MMMNEIFSSLVEFVSENDRNVFLIMIILLIYLLILDLMLIHHTIHTRKEK